MSHVIPVVNVNPDPMTRSLAQAAINEVYHLFREAPDPVTPLNVYLDLPAGDRTEAGSCPLARLIYGSFDSCDVEVDGDSIEWTPMTDGYAPSVHLVTRSHGAIRRFVGRFDACKEPEYDLEEWGPNDPDYAEGEWA